MRLSIDNGAGWLISHAEAFVSSGTSFSSSFPVVSNAEFLSHIHDETRFLVLSSRIWMSGTGGRTCRKTSPARGDQNRSCPAKSPNCRVWAGNPLQIGQFPLSRSCCRTRLCSSNCSLVISCIVNCQLAGDGTWLRDDRVVPAWRVEGPARGEDFAPRGSGACREAEGHPRDARSQPGAGGHEPARVRPHELRGR